jgi:hypothetical protein
VCGSFRFPTPNYLSAGRRPSRADILLALGGFEPSSGPGATARAAFGTGANTVSAVRERFVEPFIEYVYEFWSVLERDDLLMMDAVALFNAGVPPGRIFIKNEPTKIAKIEEGRPRVVVSVDLVVNVVLSLIFGTRLACEHMWWRKIPPSTGWGLAPDEAVAEMHTIVSGMFSSLGAFMTNDVSGWDVSYKEWMDDAEFEVHRHCAVGFTPYAQRLVRSALYVLSRLPIVDSSGVLYSVQTIYGASGRLTTYSGNSWRRAILSCVIDMQTRRVPLRPYPAKTAGDDSVEPFIEDAVAKYQSYGVKVTDLKVVQPGATFEFCSCSIGQVPIPLNSGKMLYGVLSRPFREDAWEGVKFSLRHWPDLLPLCEALSRRGWPPGKA